MKRLTPIKAIRAKCLDCCCGQNMEVRLCTAENCPLHPYRMGKRPKGDQTPPESNEGEEASPYHTEEYETDNPKGSTAL